MLYPLSHWRIALRIIAKFFRVVNPLQEKFSEWVAAAGIFAASDSWGIGVDGAASNKLTNMSTEVKNIYVLQNSREVQRCTGPGEQLEAAALSPEDVLTLFLQRLWPRRACLCIFCVNIYFLCQEMNSTPFVRRYGIENFFGLLKSELLYLQEFRSMEHFKQEIIE